MTAGLAGVTRAHSLQDRFQRGVRFLQIDAPIAKFFQRNRYAGHGAAHERARPYHTEVAVEIFDLGLAGGWRGTICTIKHPHLRASELPCSPADAFRTTQNIVTRGLPGKAR